jgi:hypothetical protein
MRGSDVQGRSFGRSRTSCTSRHSDFLPIVAELRDSDDLPCVQHSACRTPSCIAMPY